MSFYRAYLIYLYNELNLFSKIIDRSLPLVIVGLILVGIGLEALLVAGFSEAFQAAR